MTPANLVKHVAEASKATPAAPAKSAAPKANTGSLEFAELPSRYRRAPISEAEMEAIEVKIYIYIFVIIRRAKFNLVPFFSCI